MLVRYEAIWDNLPQIFNYLKNLNRKYKFPKKNRISTEVISQNNKNNFDYMYSVFYKK